MSKNGVQNNMKFFFGGHFFYGVFSGKLGRNRAKSFASPKICLLLHPLLSYGLTCWSNAIKTSLKKIIFLQNKIVRLMTQSDQRTHHQACTNPSKF